MYRSLYAFQTSDEGALSFDAGEEFIGIDTTADPHWSLVVNKGGNIGYVPANYVSLETTSLHGDTWIIDKAIERIKHEVKSSGVGCSKTQHNNLMKLEQRKKEMMDANAAKTIQSASNVTPVVENGGKNSPSHQKRPSSKKSAAPPPPSTTPSSFAANNQTSSCTPSRESVDSSRAASGECSQTKRRSVVKLEQGPQAVVGLGHEIVEQIRCNTELSHKLSQVAAVTVLTLLGERLGGSVDAVLQPILDEITNNKNGASLAESSDAVQLRRLFSELAAVKDDSQQRSWILHEDEQMICRNLTELVSILGSANPDTCRYVLSVDQFSACENLALYYQMETRLSIRLLLLQVFGCMCALDGRVISEFILSVLPLELARDIQHDTSDVQKLFYSALVLSMIFCTGDCLPLQYYAHLNVSFVDFLLDGVETGVPNDEEDQVPDVFVKLILSFNLHFELPDENVVMKCLAARGTAKIFTEKLLLLVNREADPVKVFEHQKSSPNSVLKFLSDVYSSKTTANLLYSNDAKVLIDIIVRQLTDLSSGDKVRTEYLSLMHLLLLHSEYFEHCHRQRELQSCFARIVQEDSSVRGRTDSSNLSMDRDIALLIFKQFPKNFINPLTF